MGWGVLVFPWGQDFVNRAFTDVDEHVCIGKALHRAHLIPLHRRNDAIENFAAVVLFQNLPISYGRYTVVVKLQPPCFTIGLDQCEVVSAMKVTGVNEYTM